MVGCVVLSKISLMDVNESESKSMDEEKQKKLELEVPLTESLNDVEMISAGDDHREDETKIDDSDVLALPSVEEKIISGIDSNSVVPKVKNEIPKSQMLELRSKRLQQFQEVLSSSKFYTNFLNRQVDQLKETAKLKQESQRRVKAPSKSNIRTASKTNTNSKTETAIKLTIRKRNRAEKDDITNESEENETYTVTDLSFERRQTMDGEEIPENQPKWLIGGVMRDYQISGFEWLKSIHNNGVNGILADEMGLGKTIQCIALLCYLIEVNNFGPHVIIAPLSTLSNWIAEFKRFSPDIPTILYHGPERSDLLKKFKRCRVKGKLLYPIIVTNYDTIMNDAKIFRDISWSYVVIDEGHRLKNPKCKLLQLLKSFTSRHRLLLTGTPLHNNLTELWSLLNFLLPDIFDKLEVFESLFDVGTMSTEESDERIAADEQEAHIVSTLHEILSPFLLRRLKCDVELALPRKKELLVYAPLTQKQQIYYKCSVERSLLNILHPEKAQVLPAKRRRKNIHSDSLLKSYFSDQVSESALEMEAQDDYERESSKEISKELKKLATYNHVREQNVVMDLRKCCNHPYLLSYPVDEKGYGLVNEDLVQASGKMLVIDALLPKLKERGHKVLLFSQMTRMLDIMQDYCDLRGFKYSILTGRNSLESREENIKSFNTDPENFIFLISTRAGGLGLNLIAADTVIVYDSDWNPQCDLQAVDRCHRIGQTKPVVIYRLVTANSVDQRIVDRAASKRKLEKLVMHKDKFKNGINESKRFSKTEVLELLKAKDHEGVVQSLSADEVFSKSELDVLLDRSSMIGPKTAENNVDMQNFTHFKVVTD